MEREQNLGARIALETAEKFKTTSGEKFETYLSKFSKEVNTRKARGDDPIVVTVVTGNPSAGKDYLKDFVVYPLVQYGLHLDPVLVDWEQCELELRDRGIIKSPLDQPFSKSELVATYRMLKHKLVNNILVGGKGIVCNYPGGTSLNYARSDMEKPLWWTTRDYGDKNPYDTFRLLDRLNPQLLRKVMYLEIDILRGPWMDVMQWYRQFMLNSTNLLEANYYNYLFGFSPFDGEDDWHAKKNGGSVLMVEAAQRAMHTLVAYANNSINNVPDSIVNPFKKDIRQVSKLIEYPIRAYTTRVKYNLGAGKIYDKNEEALSLKTSPSRPGYYSSIFN